jgi:formate-dependent phosphoribosylglycinamide formyltransferase (GAR transformylase)
MEAPFMSREARGTIDSSWLAETLSEFRRAFAEDVAFTIFKTCSIMFLFGKENFFECDAFRANDLNSAPT